MTRTKTILHTICLLGLTLTVAQPAFAVIQDVTYVGIWNSVGSGNPVASGGPGLSIGQKYVIRIAYDDLSFVTDNVPVLTAFFTDSGNDMSTINLNAGGMSLDIFVPMEGLDSGSPFIYQQNENTHFPAFIPNPTLNFIELSDISFTSNIIGLEFEGNYVTGGLFNVIELFNTSPGPAGADINMVSQILNCGNGTCTASAIASTDTNPDNVNNGSGFALAVNLVIDAGPNIQYSAANLTRTTSSSITQSNDLGAFRSDNEDFIDPVWSPTGTPAGTNLNDISVGIVNSGLTMTTSTTSWNVTMTEQMTIRSDSGSVTTVSYLNAAPTGSVSATPTGTGTDFTLSYGDVDLAVNALIGGFEMLTVTALVDGTTDGTAFFSTLISTGLQSSTNAALEAAFGLGIHTVVFTVTDKAGASVNPSADFEVLIAVCGNDIVEPGEECDGGACCTSTCEFESASTVCNAGSGDLCDPDELCTGSSAACPADGVASPGTVCNPGSDDACDPDEECSGIPGEACPVDQVTSAGVSCEADSDLCTVDQCDGTGDCVPVDIVSCDPPDPICGGGEACNPDTGSCEPNAPAAPEGTSCEGDGDLCTLDECDPNGDCVPVDIVSCDPTDPTCGGGEVCNPAIGSCEPNPFNAPAGTACGDSSSTTCDNPDTCDGSGTCEPNFEPSTTICNPGSGDLCDVNELCTGSSATCPDDEFASAGTVCNPGSDDACDPDEVCSGVADEACPNDVFEPSTTQCRPSQTGDLQCDPAEHCPGVTDVACPEDFVEPVTTSCGDGSTTECTEPDTCDGLGECLLFHNKECGSVTNSSLCEFDLEPTKGTCVGGDFDGAACTWPGSVKCDPGGGTCEQSDQFRLAFSPDMQQWVSYRQNSSNPGQFFYNLIYDANAAWVAMEDVTLYISIPYPFVTQGGMPLHVYDGDSTPSDMSCLAPENALFEAASAITIDDWIAGGDAGNNVSCIQVDDGVDDGNPLDICVIEVTIDYATIDANHGDGDLIYVNVHLDYGLKGPGVDADSLGGDDRYDRDGYISPWGSSDALSDTATDDGALAIADCSEHVFFHADGLAIPDIQFSDSIENLNIFKRPAGAFGSAICADDEDPLEGYIQMRKQVGNDPVFTTKIDVDGYYTAGYSHKGKAIEFYLAWCADSNCNTEHERTAPFYLQSKGFVEINLLDLDYTAPICDGSEASLEDIGPIYSKGKFKGKP